MKKTIVIASIGSNPVVENDKEIIFFRKRYHQQCEYICKNLKEIGKTPETMDELFNCIYIARNRTVDADAIRMFLDVIDEWYQTEDNYN